MGSEKAATRHRYRYSADAKAQAIAECEAPGNSMAKVAMAHGINANVVHRWRQAARKTVAAVPAPEQAAFVFVAVADDPAPGSPGDIRIELRRGNTAMAIVWPVSAAEDFAVWMRELLR